MATSTGCSRAGGKTVRIKEKLEKLKSEMDKLAAIEKQVLASPDQQLSLTDPDSRSMATSGRGSGVVGYNVQAAVERHGTSCEHGTGSKDRAAGRQARSGG
jgi:hypothetical protein